MTEKKWVVAPKISQEFQNRFPEMPGVILQLLHNRSIATQEQIDEFFNPDYGQDLHDPFLLSDMEKAVERIRQALGNNEKIIVYGDYDADGVSATAILVTVLKTLGANVFIYIPDREAEGYGVHRGAVEKLRQEGAQLIITVDCGISNREEVAYAVELGIKVIITDHHIPPPELPDTAVAIVNPFLNNYPFQYLSGAGVAFKLAQALLRRCEIKLPGIDPAGLEKWLLDIVAIATIGDVMPLQGENRTLVKYGLIVLNKTRRKGLQKLVAIANNLGPGQPMPQLDTWHVNFQITPRLNAAGRINSATIAYNLLMSDSEEEAEELAKNLNQINQERQQLVEKILTEVREQLGAVTPEQKILLAYKPDWNPGIAGLVANKLTDEFNRPTVIMSDCRGEVHGSGRSISSFNLVETFEEIAAYLVRYGGHSGAGAFQCKKENLAMVQQLLRDVAERKLSDEDLVSVLKIDCEVNLEEVDWKLFELLEKFAPFGRGNSEPCYLARGVKVAGIQPVGQNGQHLRLMVAHKTAAVRKTIGFCFGNWCEKIKVGDALDIVFKVGINEWNGNRELELKIIDLK